MVNVYRNPDNKNKTTSLVASVSISSQRYKYGTCQVASVSSTSVDIKIRAGGQISPFSPAINLSDGGNGKIILTCSDSEDTINGTIVNKTLSLTIKAGTITETFTGTKP